MTKPFDRAIQRRILEVLREAYPGANLDPKPAEFGLQEARDLVRESMYLQEHGLLALRAFDYVDGEGPELTELRITAKGIDFLADDGGLGAILGVVTIRLDSSPILDQLIAAIERSPADPTVKKSLVKQVKTLPAEVVKEVAVEAAKTGLAHLPNAAHWFQAILSTLS